MKVLPALLASSLFWACMTPPRMCAESDCGAKASCVAGRCLAKGATPAIDTARRVLFAPADAACVRPDAETYGDVATAVLGGAGDRGAVLLLRFSAAITPETDVLEAYLVLERATDLDADPAPVALHAMRIVDKWDSRSVSWARQPRVQEVGAPVTRVSPSAGLLVRLDVRALVKRWRRRTGEDFGVAVLGESARVTGMAFALAPATAETYDPILALLATPATQAPSPFEPHLASPSSVAQPRGERVGPRLELYVK